MRGTIRLLVVFLIGLAAGIMLSRLDLRMFYHDYETSRDLHLHLDNTGRVGILPAKSPLLASRKLGRNPNLGWWGCLPVRFGDETEAREVVVPRAEWKPGDLMLWATASEHAEVIPWPSSGKPD